MSCILAVGNQNSAAGTLSPAKMSVAGEAVGGQHRRGRSLPSNMVKSDRDDDLALFHDMRRRERVNYLHPSSDNDEVIESSLSSKYGALSGFRPSTFAHHKHSNDLLVSDPGKSDYDWLLTPPGTPLFPSLDHDASLSSLAQGALYARYMPSAKVSRLSIARPVEPNPKVIRGNSSPRRQSTPSSVGAAGRAKPAAVPASNPGPASRPSSRPSSPSRRPGSGSGLSVPVGDPDRPSVSNGRSLILSEGVNARAVTTSSGRPSTPTESKGRLVSSNGKPSVYGEGNVRPGTPGSRPSTPGEGSMRSVSARHSTSNDGQLRASQTRSSIHTEGRPRPWTPTDAGAGTSTSSGKSSRGDGHSQSSALPWGPFTPGEGSATSVALSPGSSAREEGYARLPRIVVRPAATDESSTKLSTPGIRSSPDDEGLERASFSDLPSPAAVEGSGRTPVLSGRPSLAADGREKTGLGPSTPRGRTLTPSSKPSSPVLRSSTAVTARPSTPTRSLTTRPSTPTRSSTTTLHRPSSGSTTAPSTRSTANRGGPSPVRASATTKSPAVYPALPDFPSEPPPNLRTTLAEGQSVSTRGPRRSSSPAPRAFQAHECETMSRPRGRASSPNMSRSFSERSSSQTRKGLVILPFDDGTEVTRRSAFSGRGTDGRKSLEELEGKVASNMGLHSKRAGRPSGARETSIFGGAFPRKSTDWQHVELRSSVGYMLLPSNTPGSSFFSGGSSSVLHRAGSNLESSMATSSNASSTFSMSADTEASEQDVDEMISEWDKRVSPTRRVEILILDKDDEKSSGWGGSQDDRDEKREASSFDRFEVESNAGSEATTTYGSTDTMSVGTYDPESRPFEFSAYGASTLVGGHEDSSELKVNNPEVICAQPNDVEFDSSINCEDRLRLSSEHKELREESDDQPSGILADNAFVDIQEDQGAGLREVQGTYEPGQGPISIDTSSWTDIQEPVTVQQMGKRKDSVSFQAGPLEELQILKHLQLNLRNGDLQQNAKLDLNSTCGSSSTCDTKLSGTGDTDSSDLQSQGSSLSVDHRFSQDWTDIQVVTLPTGGSLSFKSPDSEGKVDGNFTSASLPKYVDYSPSAYFGTDLYQSTDTGLSMSTSSWEDHQYGLDLKFWDSKACSECPAFSEDGKVQRNMRMLNMSPDKSCMDSVNKELVNDSVVLKGVFPVGRVIGLKDTACELLPPPEQRCFDLVPGHGDTRQEDSGGADDSRKIGGVVESDVSKAVILNEDGAISVSILGKDCSSVIAESVQQEPAAADTVVSGGAVESVETRADAGQVEVKDEGMVLSAVLQRLKLLKESQAVRGGQVLRNDELAGGCRKSLPSPDLASSTPGVEEGEMHKVVTQDAFSLFVDGFEEQFYSETAGSKKTGHYMPSRRSPLRAFQQGDMARSQSQSQKGVANIPPRNQTGETTEKAAIPAKVAARDMMSDEELMAFHDSVECDEYKAVAGQRAEVDCVATPSLTLNLVSFTGESELEGHFSAAEESGKWKEKGPGPGSAVRRSLTYLDTGNCKGKQSVEVQGKDEQTVVTSIESRDGKICGCAVL